jgi:ubiquinol oxidase
MRTLLFLPLLASSTTQGFVVFPNKAARSLTPTDPIILRPTWLSATNGEVETIAAATKRPASKMDERIFKFNKILIDTVYELICFLYPVKGTERDFARFFVLETVARVPYFAYLSMLHLRETFGERDIGDKMRTHYAEADNELHHLLIMESLGKTQQALFQCVPRSTMLISDRICIQKLSSIGGNSNPIDRFIAQTMAFFYYWYVVLVYALSEEAAYHLSELIEDHAYETYDNYLKDYGENLKAQPVPAIASKYYVEDNPFLFDLFCTVKEKDGQGKFSARRPKLESLYDVFVNVRDDEKEHWKTLCNLVQYGDMQGCENSKVQATEPKPVAS